jgi:hypothetical protein
MSLCFAGVKGTGWGRARPAHWLPTRGDPIRSVATPINDALKGWAPDHDELLAKASSARSHDHQKRLSQDVQTSGYVEVEPRLRALLARMSRLYRIQCPIGTFR